MTQILIEHPVLTDPFRPQPFAQETSPRAHKVARSGTLRQLRKKLLVAAASLVLALGSTLAGFEIYLKSHPEHPAFAALGAVYDFNETDSSGSLRTKADYRGDKFVEGRLTHIELNNLGMRSPDVGPRTPDEYRVLFLGDSMTFGHGVEAEEAFPNLLRDRLAKALGRPVTIGNAGIPGNGHAEHIRDLQRYRDEFQPDLIVSCPYTGNDFHGDFFGPKKVIDGYYFDTQTARWLNSNFRARLALKLKSWFVIEKFLESNLPALAIDNSTLALTPEEKNRYDRFTKPLTEGLFMDAVEPLAVTADVLDSMERNIRDMLALAGPIPVVSAILPSFVQVWPGIYDIALESSGLEKDLYQQGLGAERFRRRCESIGVECIDLGPVLSAKSQANEFYLPTDLHYSKLGHDTIADELLPAITEAALRKLTTTASGGSN